ncbi:MAG: MarR family transcriptional regulator [Candidatus Lokiarchaeota archaeon]|nr:MarR family transcriptional regulator [Candidatus Lokiarchaeota archaeon]
MVKISEIGLWIATIHNLSDRLMESKLKAHNLEDFNATQGRVLFYLQQMDNTTLAQKSIQDLIDELKIPNSSFTELIDSLVQKDLVERVPSTSDRRKIHIQKKESSFNKFLSVYKEILVEMTAAYYRDLSQEEQKWIERVLPKIIQNLMNEEKKT